NPSFFSASTFGSAVPPLRSGAKIGTFILHFLTFYGNSLPRHDKELEMWMINSSKWIHISCPGRFDWRITFWHIIDSIHTGRLLVWRWSSLFRSHLLLLGYFVTSPMVHFFTMLLLYSVTVLLHYYVTSLLCQFVTLSYKPFQENISEPNKHQINH
ncbi:hypothetical protein C8N37_1091, partial [Sphingobacterium faecium]